MKNKYYSSYFKTLGQGLVDSKYYLNQLNIEPDIFFSTIKDILIKHREAKNKIYFFAMVQVLLLQIIWP